MRKQIECLTLIMQKVFELDPFKPTLFAFCNRQRNKVTVLYWHSKGICLLYKRVEKRLHHQGIEIGYSTLYD